MDRGLVRAYSLHAEMGRDAVASVDNGGRRCNQLDRRDLEGLAKGYRGQLHKAHVLLFVHDGGCLTRQVDARLSLKAELGEIFIVSIHSQPLAHVNEHRVAGIHGSLEECLRTMSPHLVAPYLPVFHNPEARTGKLVRQLYHAGFQPGRGRDDLKGGARLIGVIDAGVPPHLVQLLLLFGRRQVSCLGSHLLEALAAQVLVQGKGVVEVELRYVYHGHQFAVLRIHDNNGHLFCIFLL